MRRAPRVCQCYRFTLKLVQSNSFLPSHFFSIFRCYMQHPSFPQANSYTSIKLSILPIQRICYTRHPRLLLISSVPFIRPNMTLTSLYITQRRKTRKYFLCISTFTQSDPTILFGSGACWLNFCYHVLTMNSFLSNAISDSIWLCPHIHECYAQHLSISTKYLFHNSLCHSRLRFFSLCSSCCWHNLSNFIYASNSI